MTFTELRSIDVQDKTDTLLTCLMTDLTQQTVTALPLNPSHNCMPF